jgi:dihydrofolate synthase / folylpolyglutamate synthase
MVSSHMISNYHEAVEYLYRNLPLFQRIGPPALKYDLGNTIRLCEAFGNPQHEFKSVHIAGTNGKGSTAHMLASVFQSAGYKTGLYTSPHLKSFTERIRVNGHEIEQQFVVDFVNELLPVIEPVKPSFFEITVVMAFRYFALMNVDIAMIEVGLGGRLDSTNVIDPELSIITNIGMDHVDLLGDTLEKIAREKAGIIKTGIPVVISERQAEVSAVFIAAAEERKSPILFASDRFSTHPLPTGFEIHKGENIFLENMVMDLTGSYQRQNVVGVVQALELLRQKGYTITDDNINVGLRHVAGLTGLKGRWQQLQERPLIFCDTGHNPEGIAHVMSQIRTYTYENLHLVLGFTSDKNVDEVMALLPKDACYYFCQANIPRAMDAETLRNKASAWNLSGIVIRDVNKAIEYAKRSANASDFIFVGGSTFVVAEIENL